MKLQMSNNCCAVARRLIAQGIDGSEILEFYRGDVLCLRGRVDAFAKTRVVENERIGPVFARWRNTLGPLLKTAQHGDVEGKDGLIA